MVEVNLHHCAQTWSVQYGATLPVQESVDGEFIGTICGTLYKELSENATYTLLYFVVISYLSLICNLFIYTDSSYHDKSDSDVYSNTAFCVCTESEILLYYVGSGQQ